MSNSEDKFDIFNQILSLEASPGLDSLSLASSSPYQEATDTSSDISIQRRQRSTLQEFLESQLGRDAPRKAPQTMLSTPPPTQPFWTDPADHIMKREEKGKKVVEVRKNKPPQEIEPQKGAKKHRVTQTRSAIEGEKMSYSPYLGPRHGAGWSSPS